MTSKRHRGEPEAPVQAGPFSDPRRDEQLVIPLRPRYGGHRHGLVIALLPAGHTRWVWERRAVLYASLMALSPVSLGVHWLPDVVGAALLGGAVAIGWPAAVVLCRARLVRGRENPGSIAMTSRTKRACSAPEKDVRA